MRKIGNTLFGYRLPGGIIFKVQTIQHSIGEIVTEPLLMELNEQGKHCCLLKKYLNCPVLGPQYGFANYYWHCPPLALFLD